MLCSIIIENLSKEPIRMGIYGTGFSGSYSNIYDQHGNQYAPSIVYLGHRSSDYRVCEDIIPGVPIISKLEFGNMQSHLKKVNIAIHYETGIYCNSENHNVVFRNIDIVR